MIRFLSIEGLYDQLTKLQSILKKTWTDSDFINVPSTESLLLFAKDHQPDIIFLSFNASKKNGIDLCKELKIDSSVSHIPIVFIYSSEEDKNLRIKALEEGADAFLSSPIDEVNLIAQVNLLLKLKTAKKPVDETHILLKKAEEEIENLKKTEKKLRDIFGSMSEGFSIQDVIIDEAGNPIDLRFMEANPAFEKQTGLINDQTLGHTLLELFPTSEDYWIKRYGKVGITGEPISFEAMFGPLNIFYRVNAFQTAPNQFGVLFTDINEKKLHEIELTKAKERAEESERSLKRGQVIAKMGFWNIHIETNEVTGSDELLKIFELEKGNLTVDTFLQVVHPDDSEMDLLHINNGIENGIPWEIEHRLLFPDGRIKWINVVGEPEKNDKNEVKSIIGIVQDITSRKNAEMALKQSRDREKLMADIVKESSIGIAIGYPNGKLGMCNKAYQTITGYTEEELQNLNWNKVLTPPEWEEPETIKLQELHRTKKPVSYEKEYFKKDGSRVPIELLVHPRFDNKGEVEYYFAFVTDITKEKENLASLQNSEIRYKTLFNDSPIPLWEEDFTELTQFFNTLKNKGVKDLNKYFDEFPNELSACTKMVKIIDVNKATLALHSAENKEQLIGKLDKTFTKNSFNVFREELVTVFNGENYYESEAEVKALTGEVKNIHITLKIDQSSKERVRALLATADITERKQIFEELENRNNYIEAIMENMPIGFAVNTIDDGNVKYLNKLFETIYGWPKEVLTNTSIFFEKVFPEKEYHDKMKTKIVSDMQSGDPKRMRWNNLKITTNKGETRYVLAYNIPLIDQNIMISTVQDVTKRKEAEEKINKQLSELQRWHDTMINREEKTIELKIEINRLLQKLGQPIKYSSVLDVNSKEE
ncbi:PAS domain S-box protein [Lentimicrobium sp. L6]|uniref:PAS domain S-box protein n=1 Tax=Lentimicrobium sp. L6 TaxID=2735916 RepID=UPI0015540BEF|nr:PAS domain S-box protein [Lentimicrobium sp. L6]NPD84485.1 PAS domain S-box protein [Lentimicrobium sp. L6]